MSEENDDCEACAVGVALSAAISICNENKDLNCEDIKKRMVSGKITFYKALDEIKKGFEGKPELEMLEGIEEVVREERKEEKNEKREFNLVDLIKEKR